MKKGILVQLLLVTSFTAFSQQGIEDMNKKELRLALQKTIISKDSLQQQFGDFKRTADLKNIEASNKYRELQTNYDNQANDLVLCKQNQQSLKQLANLKEKQIAELKNLNDAQKEKIAELSIVPIRLTTFDKIPSEYDGCSYLFAENSKKLKESKFIYFDDFGTVCLISVNDKTLILDKVSVLKENKSEITVYSNEEFSAFIHNINVGSKLGPESYNYTAELVVKDKHGQIVKMQISGEGGC
jgi:hypothetical protein